MEDEFSKLIRRMNPPRYAMNSYLKKEKEKRLWVRENFAFLVVLASSAMSTFLFYSFSRISFLSQKV